MVKLNVPRNLIGIPPSIKVNLRYQDHDTHTHTSGALQTWLFRGNSVYDPDYTNTGHQPVGFDELSAFFQYYRVVKSEILVKSSSLTADIPQLVAVRPVREIVAQSSITPVIESTRTSFDKVATNGIPCTDTRNHASVKDIFVGQNATDQDFGALVTTNPAKVFYWEIDTEPANGASTAVLALTVIVTYEVIFSQKQILTIS